jgi:hypothetical protein
MLSYLATKNPHPRDKHIHFEEGPHKYTITGINPKTDDEFTSVTTLVHEHFEHFNAKNIIAGMMRSKKWNDPVANCKYYGKTAEEIEKMWSTAGKDAAAKGTAMHHKIECFYNQSQPAPAAAAAAAAHADTDTDAPEIQQFMKFHEDFSASLKPYRTEWTIFHEEARIAGSIDMVYELIDPATATATATAATPLVIYDWKRCREITKTHPLFRFATHPAIEHIPDSNYWHYALQLNIYKYILQTKYDKTIADLYLVVLHPDAKNYNRIKLPDLQSEIRELFEERIQRFAPAHTK